MRFFKLLEIIALALLVFICIIGGNDSKNTSFSDPDASLKLNFSFAGSAKTSH